MLVLETALHMPRREAACSTGNKLSDKSVVLQIVWQMHNTLLHTKSYFQSGIKTRSV
jgi:hypothetical protein